jgi:hypothetical protein
VLNRNKRLCLSLLQVEIFLRCYFPLLRSYPSNRVLSHQATPAMIVPDVPPSQFDP